MPLLDVEPHDGRVDVEPQFRAAAITALSFIQAWRVDNDEATAIPNAQELAPMLAGRWVLDVGHPPVGYRRKTHVDFLPIPQDTPRERATVETRTDTSAIRIHLERRRKGGWRVRSVETL